MRILTRIILLNFFLALSISVSAQRNYFLYIQSEQGTRFYVKMDTGTLRSSDRGYLIIPRLKNGIYTMKVGSLNSAWPERQLSVLINRDDEGMLLKNFGERGYGFLNMKNMEVTIQGITPQSQKDYALGHQSNDHEPKSDKQDQVTVAVPDKQDKAGPAISRTLKRSGKEGLEMVYVDNSGPANDTIAIVIEKQKQATVKDPAKDTKNNDLAKQNVKEEKEKQEMARLDKQNAEREKQAKLKEEKAVAAQEARDKKAAVKLEKQQKDSSDKVKAEQDKAEVARLKAEKQEKLKEEKAVAAQEARDKEAAVKLGKEKNDSLDKVKAEQDQVELARLKAEKDLEEQERLKEAKAAEERAASERAMIAKQEKDKLDSLERLKAEEARTDAAKLSEQKEKDELARIAKAKEAEKVVAKPVVSIPSTPVIDNAACTKLADEEDFNDLDRKLHTRNNDMDIMVNIAKKAFKGKCFSVEQIRKLSEAFINDKGRFNFFYAAYPNIYNTSKIRDLETELKDHYYINRFWSMIEKK